jgi:Transposase DNA-binding
MRGVGCRQPRGETTGEKRDSRNWIEAETAGSDFKDERLSKRFQQLLCPMGGALGDSIPLACQDWANTKAAYRFLSNDRVADIEFGVSLQIRNMGN